MSASWHYLKDGCPFGPFTFDQIRQLASSGLLSPNDLVKCDVDGVWVSAGTVPGLNLLPAPATAPTVIPSPVPTKLTPTDPGAGKTGSKSGSANERSLIGAAVVWLAVVPVVLAILNRSQSETGSGLSPTLLAVGAGLAVVTWFYLGLRAVRTGTLPTVSGRLRTRPLVHRAGGLALLFVGASLGIELVNAARNQPIGATNATDSTGARAGAAGYERVSYGSAEEVLYRSGHRPDAERLSAVLRDLGEFNGQSPKTFAVERRDDGWVVQVVTTDAARRNPAVHAFYRHSLGVRIAARAFPGEPVEFQFCDPDLVSGASVALPAAGVAEIRGKDAVYFLGPYRAEADRLAAFLKPRVGAAGERAFVLTRADTVWAFAILNADADALTPEAEKLFTQEAGELSRSVFGGAATEVVVYDRTFQPKRTFRSSAPVEPIGRWEPPRPAGATINWDDYREPYRNPWKKSP